MRAWMRELILPLSVGAVILLGLIALGQYARNDLHDHERYQARFDDILVDPPPNMSREQFLLDVQYELQLPEQMSILDRDLPMRLKQAFQRNAWVEEVKSVHISPSREIRVELIYRQPVLRLRFRSGERVVDKQGVLLPQKAWSKDLPLFDGTVERPAGRTGTAWGDALVERAAPRTMSFLLSHQIPLPGVAVRIEQGKVILMKKGHPEFVWGSPPGDEAPGEEPATKKLPRLRQHLKS